MLAQAQKIALSNNKPFLLMVASALPYRVDRCIRSFSCLNQLEKLLSRRRREWKSVSQLLPTVPLDGVCEKRVRWDSGCGEAYRHSLLGIYVCVLFAGKPIS